MLIVFGLLLSYLFSLGLNHSSLVSFWQQSGSSLRSESVAIPSDVHPIKHLTALAQEKWRKKLDSQSRTLPQAVAEYRRRHGRHPPKGFDRWSVTTINSTRFKRAL